jgi:hypothetical protein
VSFLILIIPLLSCNLFSTYLFLKVKKFLEEYVESEDEEEIVDSEEEEYKEELKLRKEFAEKQAELKLNKFQKVNTSKV